MDEPKQEKAITRRINPAAFLLVLMLFLFIPSVAVSCDAPATDSLGPWSVDVSYTGAAIVGDRPAVDTAGAMARSPEWEDAYSSRSVVMNPFARGLAVVVMLAMAAGVGTAFVRASRRRSFAAVVVAGVAAVLLVVTELVARAQLETAVRNLLTAMMPGERDVVDRVGEAVFTGPGFWSALAGLVLIVALNGFRLLRKPVSS